MLEPKQLSCISLMFTTWSVREICRTVKISEKTFYLWKNNDKEFQEALKAKGLEIFEQSEREYLPLIQISIRNLEKLLRAGDKQATFKMLEYFVKLRDYIKLDKLQTELAGLESGETHAVPTITAAIHGEDSKIQAT